MIRALFFTLLLFLSCGVVWPQSTVDTRNDVQVWPDLSLNFKLTEKTTLGFFGTVRFGQYVSTHVAEQIGISLQIRLHKYLSVVPQYRAVWAHPLPGKNTFEHRYFVDVLPRLPLGHGFSVIDRNRIEFRQIEGVWSRRYRNRLQIEKNLVLHDHLIVPYLSGELFYDTRYHVWNRKQLYAGARFTLNRHLMLDPYYSRDWDDRAHPGYWHQAGLITRLDF